MARKTSTLNDMPEITIGTESEAMPVMDEPAVVVEKKQEPQAARATVSRQFCANDYLHERHASNALYRDVKFELGDVDPWKTKVTVIMGRKPTGEAETFYIRVNGRQYDLAYRQTHDVPLPIAMAWLDHMASVEFAEDIADAMTEHYQKLASEKIL